MIRSPHPLFSACGNSCSSCVLVWKATTLPLGVSTLPLPRLPLMVLPRLLGPLLCATAEPLPAPAATELVRLASACALTVPVEDDLSRGADERDAVPAGAGCGTVGEAEVGEMGSGSATVRLKWVWALVVMVYAKKRRGDERQEPVVLSASATDQLLIFISTMTPLYLSCVGRVVNGLATTALMYGTRSLKLISSSLLRFPAARCRPLPERVWSLRGSRVLADAKRSKRFPSRRQWQRRASC